MPSSSDKKPDSSEATETRSYASPPCYQHEIDPNYLGIAETSPAEQPGADSPWGAVRAWRTATRSHLLALRDGLTNDERMQQTGHIVESLQRAEVLSQHKKIGFYWPMGSEIDLRPMMTALIADGTEAALPVITEANQPLEFWAWQPGDEMDETGLWEIPVPATRRLVDVTALLIPLLGFDDQGHRLGHGGGYYDRTLAAMDPRPMTIGIGLEACRLQSIYPQAHDIPMDIVVTNARP